MHRTGKGYKGISGTLGLLCITLRPHLKTITIIYKKKKTFYHCQEFRENILHSNKTKEILLLI